MAVLNAQGAHAVTHVLPPDPIAPTSERECSDLFARYQEIHASISREAASTHDEAWRLVTQIGNNPQSTAQYDQAHRLWTQASQILSEGSAARSRCFALLYAHERTLRARDQETPDETGDSLSGISEDTAGAWALRSSGYSLTSLAGSDSPVLRDIARSANAVGRTLYLAAQIDSAMSAMRGNSVDGLTFLAGIGPYAARRAGLLNSLSGLLTSTALNLAVELNQAASDDLIASLDQFDANGPTGFRERMAQQSRALEARLVGGTGTDGGIEGMAAELDEALTAVRQMAAGRAAAANEAVALAARQRAARSANGERQRPRTGGSSQYRYPYTQAEIYRLPCSMLPAVEDWWANYRDRARESGASDYALAQEAGVRVVRAKDRCLGYGTFE